LLPTPVVAGTAPFDHPAFAPFRPLLSDGRMPDLPQLNAWAGARGLALDDGTPLTFVAPATASALAYERAIAATGRIGIRPDNWHDALNALVWLTLPRTKCALNALHLIPGTAPQPHARTRERDAATLLDESGLILACSDDDLVEMLRRRAWHALFVAARARVDAAFVPVAVGHGMLEKLRRPYRGITAHVLVVPAAAGTPADAGAVAALDAAAATRIRAGTLLPATLLPLPVAALAGWDAEALGARLFDDVSVFRPSVLV
jgi:Protein of unknown function (DUF3025)